MLNNEIVLVTGGSGCIGQHIIKLLIEKKDELGVKEIRSIDLKKYENQIGHDEFAELKTFVGDVCDLSESADKIFKGVGTVFHCANLISLQYPPNLDELYHVNVDGTQKIIELCLKFNIKNLVYTSCGSVNFLPYKNSTFSIIINQTESKALTPVLDNRHKVSPVEFDKGFLIPGYASSKLRAENIVINSCGAKLSNGSDTLKTVAIRSPIIYGEGDNHFLPPLFKCLASWNNSIPRIGGAGGKHQLVYAVLSQISAFAWFANELYDEDFAKSGAAYNCYWYNYSSRVKMTLRMLILRSQRPLAVFFSLREKTSHCSF
ncbi:3 beta-hydroxysteroid dehydrogenase/Delta 5--_4-isomerase isoform X2 [Condylostylus longicornis]|uniref:3 beta-hydroxysteroid dehydrogenase/Delta 5-->4-isomerase isoform X2 n=1 Tax=Condylostylus longicornis TaxID=2530218 RepID=UPI00244E38FE|nr:3 beta-hydroxysteroid dehydrogenase/Delta 5-->4-isomerase isoform X2 [Condylostylus longicornis]